MIEPNRTKGQYKTGDLIQFEHLANPAERKVYKLGAWVEECGWWRVTTPDGFSTGVIYPQEIKGYAEPEVKPVARKSYLFDRFLMIEKRLRDNVKYHEACIKELNEHLAAAMKEREKDTVQEPWLASWLVKQTMKSERECKGGVDRNIESCIEEINGLLPIMKESK